MDGVFHIAVAHTTGKVFHILVEEHAVGQRSSRNFHFNTHTEPFCHFRTVSYLTVANAGIKGVVWLHTCGIKAEILPLIKTVCSEKRNPEQSVAFFMAIICNGIDYIRIIGVICCGFIYPIKTGEFHIVELHSVKAGKKIVNCPFYCGNTHLGGVQGFGFSVTVDVAESYVVARVEECEIEAHTVIIVSELLFYSAYRLFKRREVTSGTEQFVCLILCFTHIGVLICLIAVKQGTCRAEEETVKHCVFYISVFVEIRDIGHKLFCGVSDFFALFLILGTVIRNEYDILCTAKQGVISFCVVVDIQLRRFLPAFRERGARRIHLFGAEDLKLITVGVRPYLE